ncbi:O-antigen ligase family protein [bacterium]|nr:O-antigen ligase family protein [bacterium]
MTAKAHSAKTPWLTAAWLAAFAFSIVTGIFLAQVFAGIGFLVAVIGLFNGWTPRSKLTPTHYLIAALLLWLVIAAIASPDPMDSLNFLQTKFLVALLGFYAAYHLVQQHGAIRWLIPALMIAGVFSALNGIVQYFTGTDFLYGQFIETMPDEVVPFYLPVGLLNMALTFAGMQMLFFLALLPWAVKQRKAQAFWAWAGMVIILLSVVLAFRRGPWMGLAGMLVLFLLTRNKKVAIISLIAGVVLIAGLFTFSDGFRTRILDAANLSTHSEQDRVLMWQASLEMGQENPVTGVGPGQWRTQAEQRVDPNHDFVSLAHPHSDPLWLLSVSGYPGLILMLLVVGSVVVLGVRLFWLTPDHGDLPSLLAQGGVLGFGGLVIAGLTQCYLLDGEIMIAMGLFLGYTLGLSRKPDLGGR